MEPRPYCILFILLWICIGSDAKWTSFINNVKSKFSLNFPFRRIFSFTRTNDQSQHNNRLQKISKVSSRSNGHVLIPALLVFFLGCHECRASPLDPQAIVINGPFFQGWLFRNIDHEKQLSFIVIIGSFSSKGNRSYVQHYIFCGVESPSNRKHIECFPAPDTVTITSTSPDTNFDIKWNSKEYGGFELRGDECIGHFKFDELTLQFRSFKRLPWSYTQPVTGGPEGWLGKTNLLPCHYYIYSTGSQCEYTLTEKEVNTSITSKGTIIKKYDDEMSSQSRVSSHGIMHIEGNYGTFFPSGWIWAQAVSSQNEASLSVIGGKFEISVFSPLSFVIYYRYRSPTAASVDIDNEIDSNYDVQVFRSTDLNRFKYRIDGVTGDSYIEAYSLLNDRKLVVRLSPSKSTSMQVNQSSCIPNGSDCINVSPYIVQSSLFGKPIHIPTANGFSNQPGCRETYTATAHVSLYRFNYSRMDFDLVHESRIDQSALEYGANFQGKVISNINGNE